MLEIKNNMKHPVQLVIRSRKAPRAFTCLNIPGVGAGKNTFLLEEGRETPYIDRAEKEGLISTRHIPNKISAKGE
jgi:hypothetical protein